MPYAKKQCLFCDAFFEPTSGRQQVCPVLECQLWQASRPRDGESAEQSVKNGNQRMAVVRYRFKNPPDLERKAEDARRWRAEDPEKARASDQASKARRRENDLDGLRRSEREKRRRQRAANPEKAKADSRKDSANRRATKPDVVRADAAAWRDKPGNREKLRAKTKKWQQNNPDKVRESWSRRDARKRGGEIVENVNRKTVAENNGWICQLCDEPIDPNGTYLLADGSWNPWYLNVDHIIPLAKGGVHSYANSQASHAICNSKKNAKMP